MQTNDPGAAEGSRLRHLRNLDGLRGYAVLIVLASHISNQGFVPFKLFGQGFGQIGVMIFFALSGFLMCYLYMERPFSRAELGTFALRRAARVLPLYFAVVLISILLTNFLPDVFQIFKIELSEAWQYLLLWRAKGVLWTIPVEVQFYCLFPVFWYLRARQGVGAMFALATLLVLLQGYFAYSTNATPFAYMPGLVSKLPFFILGIAVCYAYTQLGVIKGSWANILFVVSLALSIVMAPNFLKAVLGQNRDIWSSGQLLLVTGVLLYTSVFAGLANSLFGNQLAAFYGRISYSLYILHIPCLVAIRRYTQLDQNPILFSISALLFATLVAYLSYRFLELPARQRLTGGKG